MRAIVRAIDSPDLGNVDPETTPLLFEVYVGPDGGPGEEQFQVLVCTPQALSHLIDKDGFVIGRHFLFVDQVDEATVSAYLRRRIENISGDDWAEVAQKVGRIGLWEFED